MRLLFVLFLTLALCGCASSPPPPSVLQITTQTLSPAFTGKTYTQQLTASGGTAPYIWSATNLPKGLALSSSGVLSGVPEVPGQYQLTIQVVDSKLAAVNLKIDWRKS
ncbi:Uncharacterised protein [uncultured archaeon]|nr:Uncharacterised protein [uncultured archaeon]